MGSIVAASNAQHPVLNSLADYKIWVFWVSGGLLLLSAWQFYATRDTCPAGPKLGVACKRVKKLNTSLFIEASVILAIGFIAAYIALPTRMWLDI